MACGTISGVTPTYVVLPEGASAHLFNPTSKTYGKRQNTTENQTILFRFYLTKIFQV